MVDGTGGLDLFVLGRVLDRFGRSSDQFRKREPKLTVLAIFCRHKKSLLLSRVLAIFGFVS